MELDIRIQAIRLLLGFCLGMAGGVLYDLLRPPRWSMGRAAFLSDLIYCLIMSSTAFLFAMAAPNGRLGLWELAAVLLGFLTYLFLLSPLCLPFFSRTYRLFSKPYQITKENLKKGAKNAKKIFQKIKGCYIM